MHKFPFDEKKKRKNVHVKDGQGLRTSIAVRGWTPEHQARDLPSFSGAYKAIDTVAPAAKQCCFSLEDNFFSGFHRKSKIKIFRSIKRNLLASTTTSERARAHSPNKQTVWWHRWLILNSRDTLNDILAMAYTMIICKPLICLIKYLILKSLFLSNNIWKKKKSVYYLFKINLTCCNLAREG